MKTLKRLTVNQLDSVYGLLAQNEMRSVTGGDGNDGGYGFPGFCYYDCMSYIGRTYGSTDHAPEWYCSDYISGGGSATDDWEGSNEPSAIFGVPLYKNGKLNENAYDYLRNYYNMQGSGWATPSQTEKFFTEGNGSGLIAGAGVAMGIYQVDEHTAHTVVLTGYKDGYYEYYDPSTNKRSQLPASQLKGAALINSCKDR